MAGPGQVSHRLLGLLLLMLLILISSSQAKKLEVGGKDGWVEKPSEDYSHWAKRNRFQVNDTLNFKYQKGADSVLVVTKEDFDSCNTKNPIIMLIGGDSDVLLYKSGLFYFISGNVEHCRNGQKLIVLVMSVKQHHPVPAAPPSEPPATGLQPAPRIRSINTPAPSPSGSSRLGVGFGFGLGLVVGVVMLFKGFAGLV